VEGLFVHHLIKNQHETFAIQFDQTFRWMFVFLVWPYFTITMFIWGYYQKDGIEARNVMLFVGVPGFTIAFPLLVCRRMLMRRMWQDIACTLAQNSRPQETGWDGAIQNLFHAFDIDNSGNLDQEEVCFVLERLYPASDPSARTHVLTIVQGCFNDGVLTKNSFVSAIGLVYPIMGHHHYQSSRSVSYDKEYSYFSKAKNATSGLMKRLPVPRLSLRRSRKELTDARPRKFSEMVKRPSLGFSAAIKTKSGTAVASEDADDPVLDASAGSFDAAGQHSQRNVLGGYTRQDADLAQHTLRHVLDLKHSMAHHEALASKLEQVQGTFLKEQDKMLSKFAAVFSKCSEDLAVRITDQPGLATHKRESAQIQKRDGAEGGQDKTFTSSEGSVRRRSHKRSKSPGRQSREHENGSIEYEKSASDFL